MAAKPSDVLTPLLEIDSEVNDAVVPFRRTLPVKAISWGSKVGDQPQLRALSAGLFAVGLVRRDGRMTRAAVRMLLAHELATHAKAFVKGRVDRTRPRSAPDKERQVPHPGHDESKEESSFPSGHSAGAIAVARAFSAEYPQHGGKAVAVAAAVGLAQVPRAAHYLSDVAAGFAIGVAAEAMVDLVWRVSAAALRQSPRDA